MFINKSLMKRVRPPHFSVRQIQLTARHIWHSSSQWSTKSSQSISRLGAATRVHKGAGMYPYLGLTLEEWRGTDGHEYCYPDDLERVIRETRDTFVSGLPHESEARFRGKDGKYRWFLLRWNPVRDEQGRVTRWYSWLQRSWDERRPNQRIRRAIGHKNAVRENW